MLVSNFDNWHEPRTEALFSAEAKILALAFSPDGKHIATGLNNQMIILWDVESRLEVNRFPTHHDDWQEIMRMETGWCAPVGVVASSSGT